MKINGLGQAFALENEMHQKIAEFAKREGYNTEQLISIWNLAIQISTEAFDNQRGLVFGFAGKKYSAKGTNIIYNQKELLNTVVELGLTLDKTQGVIETIRTVLYLIYRLWLLASVELTNTQASILYYCHQENAYDYFISEEAILNVVEGANCDEITALSRMGCIEIYEGKIRLQEKVFL